MRKRLAGALALAFITALVVPSASTAEVFGTDVTYTTDADFDEGTLVSVNHDAPFGDQLQLDSPTEPFPFINVAASGRGTVVRANTETGEVVGEYRAAPDGRGLDPSRTTVDLFGNVWTANRGEVDEIDGIPHGSAVKIGLLVGGTRVDAAGQPDPTGGYVAPPFGYNTCVDRDADGLIRTSSGLLDILDWPDLTDGVGGADGVVEDAVDECILVFQRLPDAEAARHVSVDADNNVWVGGFPFDLRQFHKLDGTTGAILDSFDARDIGCGGYGGLVDGNGILWSIGWGWGEGPLLRYDPTTGTGTCVNTFGGYGLGVDTNGSVWASIWQNGIVKVSPDGVVEPGYPKTTWAPPTTTAGGGGMAPQMAFPPRLLPMPQADDAPEEAPDFWLSPDDDWVQSTNPWSAGAPISLTIEDGSGVVYTDSQTASGGGDFNFNLWDVFDLKRGHVVTVSDGTTTKMHTVTNLFVDGINVDDDTVFGRADPGTTVEVWLHQSPNTTTVTADGSGNWSADFSATDDLTYSSDGGAQQFDPDGDATGVWWAGKRIQTAPEENWVQSGSRWTPGTTVSLTIDDGGAGYTDSQAVGGDGYFHFGLDGMFDLQRGHVVTVSDGTDTKTHTVTNLYVDGIDDAADTVFGRADAGTAVNVWLHQDGENRDVTADGSGNWTADFSGTSDLTYASDGGSQQSDDDGDNTGVWWATPSFTVAPDDDWVGSMSRWTAGSTVSLTIEDGSGVIYADSQVVDPWGNFNFNLWDTFDIQRGHVVTVSDDTPAALTKAHTVTNLYVDGIDDAADTVFGRADAGTAVNVWLHQDGENRDVTADGSGNWTADFSGTSDLTYASDGGSQQFDDDGDTTGVWWSGPRFSVSPDHDWVGSMSRWTAGSTVSLTIEDGSGVLYSDATTVDATGSFNFDLNGVFDVQRGHVVTVSDGITTKTHQVIELFVDGVNPDTDLVFGHGIPDTPVDVFVHDESGAMVTVTADGTGGWAADFSGLADLTTGVNGDAQQYDDDGDGTTAPWSIRDPRIVVYRDDGFMRGHEYEAFGTVTISIDGIAVGTAAIDEGGEFWFDHPFAVGQTVIADDGRTAKTHVVTSHTMSVVDHIENTAAGTADPLSWLTVEIEGSPVNIHREVQADAMGNWSTDFDVPDANGQTDDITPFTSVNAWQTDNDGDNTTVSWRLPRFAVDVDHENVRGDGWTREATLSISVDGAPLATVTTDQGGYFDVGVDVDLMPGQVVTVTGPEHIKTLLLTDPGVTGIDEFTEVVTGTATPLAQLDVWAARELWAESSLRTVTADGSGVWSADFGVPFEDWPALDLDESSHVTTYEWDDDGDATIRNFGPPIQANRGVAVTPLDNHVWVANSGVGTVTRLDNDGNILTVIEVGNQPTGVAVDAAGKVWATNLGSDNTVRIDPNAGTDGLGAVDLTVDLGEGASPYNYSDMTGAVVVGSTSPQGFWTAVQDSGQAGFEWGRITWNTEPEASEPHGSEIVVEARTADSEAGLGAATFAPVSNGELFSSFGRFIEVRVTLKASPDGLSPVLSDIRVQPAVIDVDIDIKPGSYPNTIKAKRTTGVIPVAVLGSAEFDVMTIDVTTLTFGPDRATPAHDLTVIGGHHEDVDRDGYLDLVSHYTVGEVGLVVGDTAACLYGQTIDGIPIEGCDSVRMR